MDIRPPRPILICKTACKNSQLNGLIKARQLLVTFLQHRLFINEMHAYRNHKLKIYTAPTKAKTREPAYSQANRPEHSTQIFQTPPDLGILADAGLPLDHRALPIIY